ncbi:MAG: exo-alpha-sialidase [Fibrella sp.]|nr:exo-alpha-sialidase [Armatimonadota bacterium]
MELIYVSTSGCGNHTSGFRREQSNYYGGESLALDPQNPNIVYLAAGKYTADWAPKGAIFKSVDRGKTWKKLPLELKMGSNEDYRTSNPRLVVNPTRSSVLLFGSRRA